VNSLATALRPRERVPSMRSAQMPDRWARRWACLAWSLLYLNVLTFYPTTWNGLPLGVPIPHKVGQALTQGALLGALIAILIANRRCLIRPNVYLCLVSLLTIDAVAAGMLAVHPFPGTAYRTVRLALFVVVLWLITPWWGRRDLLLVRCHLALNSALLGSVLLGFLVKHRLAMDQNRLAGVLWPIPPTGVAEFAAITIGLVVVLWLGHRASGRTALLVVAVAGAIMVLTHTRTALVAMFAGMLVATLSLFTIKARARKLLTAAVVMVSLGVMTLSSVIITWLSRGEGTHELTSLTGRTVVWSALLSAPRSEFQVIFGSGMSNLSFNGLPIDSNWLAAYNDLGLVGVTLCAMMLLFPLTVAYFKPRGVERALALFVVTYCLVSSFTETGLSNPSMFLLELTLGVSLLASSARGDSPALPSVEDAPAPLLTVTDLSLYEPSAVEGGAE
jgi:hypothetical protein